MNRNQRRVHRMVWWLLPLIAAGILWQAESMRRGRQVTPPIGARLDDAAGGGR